MTTLIEPLCSECNTAPWEKHCCTCEPCVIKRDQRAKEAVTLTERERLAKLPQPQARICIEGGPWRTPMTSTEKLAYRQAWEDYASAIREEPTDD